MKKKLDIPMFGDPSPMLTAANHPEGNAFYKNLVDIVSPEYDAISANGTGLVLGATNDLPIPVHHDLGAEMYDTFVSGETTASGISRFRQNGDGYAWEVGKTYRISIDYDDVGYDNISPLTIFLGTAQNTIITRHKEAAFVTGTAGNAFVEFTIESSDDIGGTNTLYNYIRSTAPSVVSSFDTWNVQQITTTGYLTYETDDGVVQIGNAVDGGSKELVVNGTFDTDTDGWTQGTTAVISSEAQELKVVISAIYDGASQSIPVKLGRTYLISVDGRREGGASNYTIGLNDGSWTILENYTDSVMTTRTFEYVSTIDGTVTLYLFSINVSGELYFDNVSIKEILPTSTTYTLVDDTYRWAYVNENPFSEADLTAIEAEPNKIVEFAMDGTGLTNTQGVDDKFYGFRENEDAYCVDALGYGANIPLNSTFDTDTEWVKGFGVTISGGQCHANDRGAFLPILTQSGAYVLGKVYLISATVEGVSAGNFRLGIGDSSNVDFSDEITTNGTTEVLVKYENALAPAQLIFFNWEEVADYSIDNFEAREATASEIANYAETIRTATANSQTSIQWTCAELDGAGVPTAYNSTPNTAIMHSDTSISTGFKPSIARYSIEENITGELQDFGSELIVNGGFDTDTDWTTGDWTIANGVASIDTLSNDPIYQDGSGYMEVGKTYIMRVEIKNYVRGSVRFELDNSATVSGYFSGDGVYTFIGTALDVGAFRPLFRTGASGFNGSIDNVSIKELTTKTQRTEQRLLTHTDVHLGMDISKTANTVDAGWIDNGDGTYTGTNASSFVRIVNTISMASLTVVNDIEIIDISNGSVSSPYSGSAAQPATDYYDTVGTYTDSYTYREADSESYIEGVNFTGTIRLISIREVSAETKYYIDGIEQPVTPPLPDPAVTINLNDTAVIGYPDTIESRSADFKVHSEVIEPTFVVTGPNLYPNWELINGSHINQDIPLGTLPDGHTLAFNTANPCNATYTDNGGTFSYLFNQVQDPARLVFQQTIGYGVFEVGKRYRYQAKVRTVTFSPIAVELRAIHIAAAVELTIVDNDNAMIGEEEDYTLRWIDFEVTDGATGRANFRHGCGVWDVLTTAQETIELAIYELTV